MNHLLNTIVLLAIFLTACNENKSLKGDDLNKTNKPYSPIEGNWILVSNEVNGKQIKPKRSPQQFKMFHDGFFSFIMYDSSGNFYYAGAGPYELNGNIYTETLTYSSDTMYNDSKDWQRWEMRGDTLIFYGFEKAETAGGRDITKEWGGLKFIEKRVKAKR